jgi:hypothetical protein
MRIGASFFRSLPGKILNLSLLCLCAFFPFVPFFPLDKTYPPQREGGSYFKRFFAAVAAKNRLK